MEKLELTSKTFAELKRRFTLKMYRDYRGVFFLKAAHRRSSLAVSVECSQDCYYILLQPKVIERTRMF